MRNVRGMHVVLPTKRLRPQNASARTAQFILSQLCVAVTSQQTLSLCSGFLSHCIIMCVINLNKSQIFLIHSKNIVYFENEFVQVAESVDVYNSIRQANLLTKYMFTKACGYVHMIPIINKFLSLSVSYQKPRF